MKRKLFLVLFLTVLSVVNGNGQISWERLFSYRSTDVFRDIVEVPAGGYLAAGYTADSSSNDTDAYAVRLNTSGDTIWTFKYNGPLSGKDLFYKVINTLDGGFAFCGYTTSVTGLSDDVLYLKLNSSGHLQWVKFWGGNGKERAQEIIQTPDSFYTIVGYTTTAPAQYYDAFLMRTKPNGDTLWIRRYGSSNYDDANSVQQLADGGYILGGQSNNGSNLLDQYLIRTNANGDTLWTKKNGTTGNDNIECLRKTSGGFVMVGSTNSLATGDNGYLVKTDTGGTVLWSKSFGSRFPDDLHSVDTVTGGGYICAGTTSSTSPTDTLPNMWMLRTTSLGDSLWSQIFGGPNHDHGYSAHQTSDKGFIIAGHSGSFGYNSEDGYVVKTDSLGNVSNLLRYTGVFDLLTPTASTCGGPNTQIKVIIKNYGNAIVDSVPVTVQITGSLTTTLHQTWTNPVSAFEWDTLTFNTTINTSGGGTYTFYCYTSTNNNVYPANNSLTRTLTLDGNSGPPAITNNSRCGNGTVILSASSGSNIYWFAGASGGTSIYTGPSYTTPNLNSTTTYYVQTGLNCPSSRVPITATINPVSPDPVTTGNSHCGSDSLVLTATDPDPISWFSSPTGGSPVGTGTSFTTPYLTATTNYYAQASNGTCPSHRVVATANIGTPASDPVTTSGQNCGPGSVTLTATSGNPVLWFDAPTGGNQVGTGNIFVTPTISSTTIYYAQADNGCISNRVATTATINSLAADPLAVPGQNCGPGSVTLGATASNLVIWYNAQTGGNQLGTGATFSTPVITTTTVYYAQTNNGTCPSNRVAVTATIFTPPVVNLGPDTSISGTTYIIDAGIGFSQYSWSTGETTRTITISHTDTFCVTVTDANGCTGHDCIFVDISTGINSVNTSNSFSVFPNPASGIFTIAFRHPAADCNVELLDITGNVIMTINAHHAITVNANLSSFAKGIYLVRILENGNSETQRIIIQ